MEEKYVRIAAAAGFNDVVRQLAENSWLWGDVSISGLLEKRERGAVDVVIYHTRPPASVWNGS